MSENLINTGIYITYGLLAISALAAIIFPIVHYVKDIKKAKGPLLGLGVLVIIILFAYLISSGVAYEGVSAGVSRWISAGIKSVFILAGLAIIAAVYTEVAKLIKIK